LPCATQNANVVAVLVEGEGWDGTWPMMRQRTNSLDGGAIAVVRLMAYGESKLVVHVIPAWSAVDQEIGPQVICRLGLDIERIRQLQTRRRCGPFDCVGIAVK